MSDLEAATNLAVAGLAGLAVGIEREWSGHATGPHARFAGVRTFLLLGLIGGAVGWMWSNELRAIAVALTAVTSLLVVMAYFVAAQRSVEDIDGTTEVAALAVIALGISAGLGHLRLASGVTAVIVLALGEKRAVQAFIRRIGERELMAALQFAVLALVVLPLLPAGPFGPYGAIRPRSLWAVVLLFSGLNFIGYLARRAVGDRHGYPLVGALGGVVSSTAVTLGFSRQSRTEPTSAISLALGTLAASVILFPRVITVAAVLNPAFAVRAAMTLAPMVLGAAIVLFLLWKKQPTQSDTDPSSTGPANPLQLLAAVRMAVLFQVVLLAMTLIRARFGDVGLFATAAIVGLTDVDALTFGMSRLASETGAMETAGKALLLGIVVNTMLKATIALFGEPRYRRRVAPSLAVTALIGAVALLS